MDTARHRTPPSPNRSYKAKASWATPLHPTAPAPVPTRPGRTGLRDPSSLVDARVCEPIDSAI